MPISEEFSREAHQRRLAQLGGPALAFAALAGRCLQRFLVQNGRSPLPERLLADYTARLWTVVNGAGWPRPLRPAEAGAPGEMPAERVAGLMAEVFAGSELSGRRAELDTPTRQLLKACLQPEFRQCRDSYREVVAGICRRQELGHVRERMSGSHCVDCPYWTALSPEQHARLLARAWVSGGKDEFAGHQEIFLPEDFRALRVFVRGQIRAA